MSDVFGELKDARVDGLVDEAGLASWLDAQGLGAGRPLEVERISGGMSNESIGLTRGDERWVLRRPAKVALAGADRGMQREFRMLRAIADTPVPHPRALALCTDPDVIGCTFYVMAFVDGFSALRPLPERFAKDATLQREAALSTMQALGELARVDWRERGLEGFGKPEGFHDRQVARWLKQLDSYKQRELPGVEEVGRWLEANKPQQWQDGIMHGDYHTGNILLAPNPPGRVTAILDWENCTIGDPLLDLAGFLRMWDESDRAGWCEREALIAKWEEHSGRTAPDLLYYATLSAFKLAVMLEGIYQRAKSDDTRGGADPMGEMAMQLLAAARESIEA